MKITKKHFAVIIAEVIMMVMAVAGFALVVVAAAVMNTHPFIGFQFNIEVLIPVIWIAVYYFFVSSVIFFSSLFSKTWIGLLYVVEYQILGVLVALTYSVWPVVQYPGSREAGILLLVALLLATLAMVSAFAFLILFFVYATSVHKRKKAIAEEKRKERMIKQEAARQIKQEETNAKVEEEVVKQKEEAKAIQAAKEEGEKEERVMTAKVYHVSQHPTTNKWQVKLAKGEKALKLFDTQAEALAYAKEVAKKQGGSVRLHSKKGKMRSA